MRAVLASIKTKWAEKIYSRESLFLQLMQKNSVGAVVDTTSPKKWLWTMRK